MPLQTTRTIEIGAPPSEVFSWLIEPDKLKAWTDAQTKLPVDTGELRVGYSLDGTFQAPDGERKYHFEITAYDPPRALSYEDDYAGGKATVAYTLTESGAGTRLDAAMSADTAAPVTTVPDAVKAQIAQLPAMQRQMAEQQMQAAMKQMQGYDASTNPQAVQAWNEKIDAELSRLKELVELVRKEAAR
jgi:uncharacterized protein YndB with AHSA1/START domain